jgi:two-component system response regulator AtoC
LERAIEEAKFREDLYYRLNVINLELPPLRERREDILPLADYLLKKHNGMGKGVSITGELRDTLLTHPWPGNIRELENVVRRLIVLRNPKYIVRELNARGTRKSLAAASIGGAVAVPSTPEVPPILEQVTKAKERAETEAILAALNSTRWNRKQAAAFLKIDYKALLYKMKKLGIDDEVISFPPSPEEPVHVMTANRA